LALDEMAQNEWLELYRHLLGRLDERGLTEVRAEIETAASAPVFEERSAEETERIFSMVKREVGRRVLRPRTPREVVEAAIGVLHTRLVELPAIASAMVFRYGRPEGEIEFRVDFEEQYAPRQSEPVSLAKLTASPADRERIERGFLILGISPKQVRRP